MRTAQAATQCAQRPGPGRHGVTVGSAVSGFELGVSPIGEAGVSGAGLVGSAAGELSVEVGADALGVAAGAVVSGDAGGVTEAEASGCAVALAEAEGEADVEVLALGEALLVAGLLAAGPATGLQPPGLVVADGVRRSFLRSGVLTGSGFGSLWVIPGTAGMTPVSLATQTPPTKKPIAIQSTRMLLANRVLISRELVTG